MGNYLFDKVRGLGKEVARTRFLCSNKIHNNKTHKKMTANGTYIPRINDSR